MFDMVIEKVMASKESVPKQLTTTRKVIPHNYNK